MAAMDDFKPRVHGLFTPADMLRNGDADAGPASILTVLDNATAERSEEPVAESTHDWIVKTLREAPELLGAFPVSGRRGKGSSDTR